MHRQTNGVTEFMVPFFLVNIGMQLDLSVFRNPSVILLSVIVTLVAVATKFLACGMAALGLGLRGAAQVGIGMVPRGEVGIVVAQLGLSLAIISTQFYGIVLFMAIATTLIAPPFIKWLFASERAATEQIGPDDAGGILRDGEHCRIG
jgi:Kef-type K+ transport system membrane component KefB